MRGARDSTAVADDCGNDGVAIVEALGLLEVGRVQILGTMRKKVETCFRHQLVPFAFHNIKEKKTNQT